MPSGSDRVFKTSIVWGWQFSDTRNTCLEGSFVIGSEYTSSLGSFSKPENYVAHESSVLLGTAVSAKKSNKYYKYKDYFLT